MQEFSSLSLCGLFLSLLTLINADITLSNIPTSECSGSATRTAIYTTSLALETGSQFLSAGNLWKQPGAQWTFALSESSIYFASVGAIVDSDPSNPGVSSTNENTLILNPFRSTWTLTIPNPIPPDPYDIYFEVTTKTSKRHEIPSSAKFRFRRDSGQYNLEVEGTLQCGITPSGTSSSNGSTTLNRLELSQSQVSVMSPSSQISTPGTISSILSTSTSIAISPSALTFSNALIPPTTSSLSLYISPTFNNLSASSSSSALPTGLRSSSTSTPASAAFPTGTPPSYISTPSTSSTGSSISLVSSPSLLSVSSSSLILSTCTITPRLSSTSSVSVSASTSTSSIPGSPGSSTSSLSSSTSPSTAQTLSTLSSSSTSATSSSSSVPPAPPPASSLTPTTTIALTLGSSAIASSCSNDDFSAVAVSWTAFNARSYMSSLLSAAEPSGNPTAPLPGASLIHGDVNPPGAMCTFTAHCDPVSCSTVKDSTTGSELSVQRFLAYQSVVNFNNYLNSVMNALLDSGTIASLTDANLITNYFTNKAPDATWMQIMAIFTPLLSIVGSFIGSFGLFAGQAAKSFGEVWKVAAQLGSSVTAGNVAGSIGPVVDKRFSEYASITDFIGEYLKAVIAGVEHSYDTILGKNASMIAWTGTGVATDPDIVRDGFFGGGVWVNSDYTIGLESNLLQNFIRIFTYKAINFAWIDSGCFIIYVPYGRSIKGTEGEVIEGGINEHWCQTQLQNNNHLGLLTICDAPGGMARIVNSDTLHRLDCLNRRDWMAAYPKGFDGHYPVLPGEPLDVAGAIRGSVNSWLVGDFDYDASNPYNESFASGAGLSIEQIQTLANLKIAPETAGFFNIPVCETFDLRWFPPAKNAKCITCGFGGTPGSTKRFMDVANDAVKKAIKSPPICAPRCPRDAYGPVHAQQNAAGYSPGWCGVHVTQYQRNEGPGEDPTQFRLSATIYDGENININVPVNGTPGQNTLVQAPDGVQVGMTSRLPSPLMLSVGPGDNDPVLFKYPGNAPWGSNDQAHHCDFGKYDGGMREGDCGFTCA